MKNWRREITPDTTRNAISCAVRSYLLTDFDKQKRVANMNLKKFGYLVLTVFLISACSQVRVGYDYDKESNIPAYKTFNWHTPPDKDGAYNIMEKRIIRKVERQLETKGLLKTEENPDFLIALHGTRQTKVNIRDWGYSCNRFGVGVERLGGLSGMDVYQYSEGTIILDFIDARTKELFWRGMAVSIIDNTRTPAEWEELVDDAVSNMLKNYPPPPQTTKLAGQPLS